MPDEPDKNEWERRAKRKADVAAISRTPTPAPKAGKPPSPTDWTRKVGVMAPGDMRGIS